MSFLLSLCCSLTMAAAAPEPAVAVVAADSVRTLNTARNAVRTYTRRAPSGDPRALRPDVIDQLDAAAAVIPGDDWIAGYRIGLRIKQGWHTAAVAAALRCEATPWWCGVLAGFAFHVEGSYAEADAAFTDALAAMPRDRRCAWTDELLHVLDGPLRAEYAAADCDARVAMEPRIWWLADPLHVLPGNDRRSEHYARLVGMVLHHEQLALTGSQPCAHTHHEAIIRAGWPDWWWGPGPLDPQRGGARFMPAGAAGARPLQSLPDDWDVAAGSTSERYAPRYGQVRTVEQQTAFFARGDSIVVVAAAGLGRTRAGGLALSRNEFEAPVIATAPAGGGFVLSARVPRDEWLVSIEAVREPAGAVRARFGHALPEPAPGGLALSDLLLINWSATLPETLEDVAPRMLGTTRFAGSRTIGLYWEVYGAADTTAVEVALSAEPADAGLLDRLGRRLGLVAPGDGVAVRWQDTGAEPGILRKHLRLDLSHLPAGRYVLQMEVRQGDGEPAIARRAIELTGS